MKENLLCAILAAPRHAGDVSDLMRLLRAMRDAADALLLFCDLPDASSAVLPEDDALIRSLQSGVMTIAARMPKRFLLLVRSRVWDDAARRYLGESQPIRPHAVIAGLMDSGHALSAFSAASFSPASLAAQFSAVLFLPGLSGLFQVSHMTAGQYGLIVLLAFLPTAAIQIYKVLCDRRK